MDIYKRKCDADIERLQAELDKLEFNNEFMSNIIEKEKDTFAKQQAEIDEERKARIKAENEAVDLLVENFVIPDLKAEIDELVEWLRYEMEEAGADDKKDEAHNAKGAELLEKHNEGG